MVSSEKLRDATMRNMGAGFVVLSHHSLLLFDVFSFPFSELMLWSSDRQDLWIVKVLLCASSISLKSLWTFFSLAERISYTIYVFLLCEVT